MPHPLSMLGIVHTGISLVPVAFGIYSFARFRKIAPNTGPGRVYLGGLVLSVVTSFGLSSTGGFNAGHALGILALLVISAAMLAPRLALPGRARFHLATFGLSFSFFLLVVPGINETLTRLPIAHPLADGSESPVVVGALAAWFIVFLIGYTLQVRNDRAGANVAEVRSTAVG